MASATGIDVKPGDGEFGLWHAYAKQLAVYFGYDKAAHTAGMRIYSVPLTSTFLTVGVDVSEEVKNHDLFRLGDLLLPPNSPVFIPRTSYSQRLLRHLDSVRIGDGHKDAASWDQLDNANQLLEKLTEKFLACRQKAYLKWQQDPECKTISFPQWVDEYFPDYSLTRNQRDGAAQYVDDAADDFFGSQAVQLVKDKRRVNYALSETPNSYNMPTSPRQATVKEIVANSGQLDSTDQPVPTIVRVSVAQQMTDRPASGPNIKYAPRYTIDSNFDAMILNWITTASQLNRMHEIMKFEYSSKQPTKNDVDWGDVGFATSQVVVPSDMVLKMPLFTASWGTTLTDDTSANVMRNLHDQPSTATVTISATDCAVFQVNPDTSWDIPDFASAYPNLRADAPQDLYESPVLVTNVFLGYQVSVEIVADQSTYDAISEGLIKAKNNDGVATLAGVDVGPSTTSSDSLKYDQIQRVPEKRVFRIPPRNTTQVTVLGIMGKTLKAPNRPS